jgi:hypothetical protein
MAQILELFTFAESGQTSIAFDSGTNTLTIGSTGAGGGGGTNWNLSVEGDSTNITDGETVEFTGQGNITLARNGNTVEISGADQDLSGYATTGDLDTVSGIAQGAADDVVTVSGLIPTGTANGVAFFGDDNNLTESSKLVFTSGGRGELNIDNQTGIINITEIETTGSQITLDYGTAQLVRFVEGNFSDPIMVSFRNNGFGFRDGNPAIFDGSNPKVRYEGSNVWRPESDGLVDHGSSSIRWQDYYGYRMDLENPSSSSVVLKVQGAASQSANLQEWQDSAGNTYSAISDVGNLIINTGVDIQIYNTGTDGDTDYERLRLYTSSNVFWITSENGGAGSQRSIRIGDSTEYIQISTNGLLIRANNQQKASFYNTIEFNDNILPDSSNTFDVGSTSRVWNYLYANTGIFYSGVQFPDGVTQTVAYTGQTGDWKVGVSGLTDTITSGETVTFTGAGTSNVFYDDSTNTLTISGQAGAGMTSWDLSVTGDSTTISDGETVTFSGQDAITTTRNGNTVIISGAGGGGSDPTGTASGVAFFNSDNTISSSYANTGLIYDSGNQRLGIGISPTESLEIGGNNCSLQVHSPTYNQMQIESTAQLNIIYAQGGAIRFQSDGATLMQGDAARDLGVGGGPGTSQLQVNNDTTTDVGLTVVGAAAQSANLQEWQDNAGTVLASVDNTGNISGSNNLSADGTLTLLANSAIHRVGNGARIRGNSSLQWVQWGTYGGIDFQSSQYNSSSTDNSQQIQNRFYANGTETKRFHSNGGMRLLDIGNEVYQGTLGLQFTSGSMNSFFNPNAIIRTSGTNTLFMYAEDGVKIMNLGDVGVSNSGYTGIGTEYRDLTARTGIFTSGVQFPDGVTQTVAYTGQTGDWKVGVSGLTDTITSGETVTFTGLGLTTVTYDASTNTVSISGAGDGSGGGGGGTPGGSDSYVQYNDGGSFGGVANFTWNDTSNVLTVSGDVDITGALTATTKSFLIDHPTKEGMKLQYASLEGPENGVYVRGTTDQSTIQLPDYWVGLVDGNSITVTLTPVGSFQQLYVEEKSNTHITVGGVWGSYDYVVYGERKDVDKLEVEW